MNKDDERLYQQTIEVHRAVSERLGSQLWEGLSVIDEVDRDAAYLGTMTALLQDALFLRALWFVLSDREEDAEEDRADFVRFAGDCWDDANREPDLPDVASNVAPAPQPKSET